MVVTTTLSIADSLHRRALETPERTAYTFLRDGVAAQSFTYDELHRRAQGLARVLLDKGATGRVLLVYPSGLEYIAAFFGCLYAGAVPVPLYPPKPNRPDPRLAAVAEDSQAVLALTTAKVLADATSRLPQQPALGRFEWLPTDAGIGSSGDPDASLPGLNSGDSLAYLQYTSGSTSAPKGVMVTHHSLLHTLEDLDRGWRHDADSVMVTWLPLFHDMGLIYGVLQPLYNGFPCYLMEPAAFLQRPLRWLEAVSRYRGTHSAAPNFAFDLCVKSIQEQEKAGLDLSSWRMVLNAAEPVRAETLQRFAGAFAACGFSPNSLCPGYGLAESSLKVTAVRRGAGYKTLRVKTDALQQGRIEEAGEDAARANVLVGCGGSDVGARIAIVDPETLTEAPADRVGEIWVAGGSVAAGYWNRTAESEESFRARLADTGEGPFLRTGDLGFLREGQLYLTGRLKDLIIIRGANHYPQDIELTVENSHPSLRPGCGAAFSVEAQGEERLVVLQEIKRTESRKADLDAAMRAIREAVASSHALAPHAVVLLSPASIPKTSSGKIQRRACRDAFLTGSLKALAQWREPARQAGNADHDGSPEFAATAEFIERWLLNTLAQRLGTEASQLDASEPFVRFGVDSLAAVRLSGELESLLGRTLPATLLFEHPTPKSLARFLADQVQPAAPLAPSGPIAEDEGVAVIGLACRFPGAPDAQAFWRLLCGGTGQASSPPVSRGFGNGARPGWFLDGIDLFDAEFFGISPKEAENMDPQQRLLLEVAWEALESAGQPHFAGSNTGVFVGISTSDYFRMLLAEGESPHAHCGTGGALSIAANRLSYLLDLRGPSWAVDTACSSSLVAVHQACQSLRLRECDMALAAGVNLMLSPELSEVFAKAGMLAEDGRCKTFDADADGYGRGEGCGVLVLKRRRDALSDGDRILALLAGSAVNQDGRSNGLTAPNGLAQQEVIRRALRQAKLPPSAIGYVEAHGTGTPLGDPIEINALKAVLLEERTSEQPCLIGSVKPAIGHLEAAAGIAGLIKTVLILQHGQVPRQRNFSRLNPHIQLEGTRLSIPAENRPWPAGTDLRAAGVSSFGFGGTNAHVVVCEAVPTPMRQPVRADGPQILTLSAKHPAALNELAGAYGSHLAAHPEQTLADVCYSANTGRVLFRHRLAIAADSHERLQQCLRRASEGGDDTGLWRGEAPLSRRPRLAFLFTGQGSQYPGMGRRLYETQPAFRNVLAQCGELLRQHMEPSLLEILYGDHAQDLLTRTGYAQPALFALEYSLARLWQSFGTEAHAVMGHSLGEYVAACVADVFGLEDGLRLAAARGRLMQEAPGRGGMAAVFAGEEKVRAALEPWAADLRIAAINGPANTVISGDSDALAAACAGLAAQGIGTKPLATSHAFHSALMKPVADAFESVAASVSFGKPRITLISNLSGGPAGDEIRSPAYWRRHLLEPVRFAQGMESLEQLQCDAFLELGPQPVLLGMGRQCLPQSSALWAPSLRKGESGTETMLGSLAGLYVRGAEVDWRGVYRGQARRRVALPSYPFQRQRYWFKAQTEEAVPGTWLHELTWQSKPRIQAPFTLPFAGKAGTWLVFADASGLGEDLAGRLEAMGQHCRLLYRHGPGIRADFGAVIDPHQGNAVRQAVEGIAAASQAPIAGVVYLWCLPDGSDCEPVGAGLDQARSLACDTVAGIVQALDGLKLSAKLWLVTRGTAAVAGPSAPPGAQALLLGTGKVVALEHPDLWGGMVDLALEPETDEVSWLLSELQGNGGEDQVAWRGGRRFAARIAPARPVAAAPRRFAADATYLITGGLGALGLATAQWMLRQGARNLVLVGRREAEGTVCGKLRELRAQGATVLSLQADVSQPEAVAALIHDIASRLPPLKGIVHAAGEAESRLLRDFRPGAHSPALAAKVAGAWLLHRHTQGLDLDFFVCYSSIAAILGAHGQTHYAAANRYLDALAHYRRGLGLAALSINWGPWGGGGMASADYRRQLERLGVRELPPARAVSVLGRCLAGNAAQIMVADVDWPRFNTHAPSLLLVDLVPAVSEAATAWEPLRRRLQQAVPHERRRLLVEQVRMEVGRVLGFPADKRIDELQGFFDLGMDSLATVELNRRLEQLLGERLPPTLAFEAPHVESLASRLETLLFPCEPAQEPVMADAAEDPDLGAIRGLSERELELYVDQELQRALQ